MSEAAEFLETSPNTLRNWSCDGKVRAQRNPIEGYRRFRRADREVLPHAADARHLPGSVETRYEVGFTRYFYKPQPLRTLEEIRADILALTNETEGLLGEIIGGASR